MKKRYVIAGTGVRARSMFVRPLLQEYAEYGEIAGIFDVNPLRMEFFKKEAGLDCPSFTDFNAMLEEVKPDTVIVTTIDSCHHKYIIGALKAGCDAVSE
ncbi:MAG: Gfo/Idh/MocA family oxidoreductase, partial [bacterium]|nr:Gfo/Idh/MocA family oxidoreductase [bacterium]